MRLPSERPSTRTPAPLRSRSHDPQTHEPHTHETDGRRYRAFNLSGHQPLVLRRSRPQHPTARRGRGLLRRRHGTLRVKGGGPRKGPAREYVPRTKRRRLHLDTKSALGGHFLYPSLVPREPSAKSLVAGLGKGRPGGPAHSGQPRTSASRCSSAVASVSRTGPSSKRSTSAARKPSITSCLAWASGRPRERR